MGAGAVTGRYAEFQVHFLVTSYEGCIIRADLFACDCLFACIVYSRAGSGVRWAWRQALRAIHDQAPPYFVRSTSRVSAMSLAQFCSFRIASFLPDSYASFTRNSLACLLRLLIVLVSSFQSNPAKAMHDSVLKLHSDFVEAARRPCINDTSGCVATMAYLVDNTLMFANIGGVCRSVLCVSPCVGVMCA